MAAAAVLGIGGIEQRLPSPFGDGSRSCSNGFHALHRADAGQEFVELRVQNRRLVGQRARRAEDLLGDSFGR